MTTERLDRRDRACHWYNTDFVFDRIYTTDLSPVPPVAIQELSGDDLITLTGDEKHQLLELYSFLVGKLAAEYMPCFQWLKELLPDHLPHRRTEEMAKKSDVFMLPLLFKDEKRSADCIEILDETVNWLESWYTTLHPGISWHIIVEIMKENNFSLVL